MTHIENIGSFDDWNGVLSEPVDKSDYNLNTGSQYDTAEEKMKAKIKESDLVAFTAEKPKTTPSDVVTQQQKTTVSQTTPIPKVSSEYKLTDDTITIFGKPYSKKIVIIGGSAIALLILGAGYFMLRGRRR